MMHEKIKGTNAERLIYLLLKLQFKKTKMILRSDLDIDIELYKDDIKLLIEVKSCSHYVKNGKKGLRKGRFILRHNDFNTDYFCFIIPDINYIKFVAKSVLESYLYEKKLISIWNDSMKRLDVNTNQLRNIKNCRITQKELKFYIKGVKINDIYK